MAATFPLRPAPRPARLSLLLLAAVFILPFVVGTGLFWLDWRPAKFGNHGDLVQPPRPLPASGLLYADGRALPTSALLGKWLLILPFDAVCTDACEQELQAMQRVHVALNKEQSRLRRVLLRTGPSGPGLAQLQDRFPDLVVTSVDEGAEGSAWRDALTARDRALYIADPLGNVMMRYAEPGTMSGVLKDLERLLKYSWIR